MRILYLLPYELVPVNLGNKHHTFNLIRYAMEHANVDIAMLCNSGVDAAELERDLRRELPKVKGVRIFPKPSGMRKRLFGVMRLCQGLHPSLGGYWNRELALWLQGACAGRLYDVVHFDMIHMVQYKPFVKNAKTLLVASDAYSLAASIARKDAPSVGEKIKLTLVSWLLLRTEKAFYPRFDTVSSVSPVDATYFGTQGIVDVRVVGIPIGEEFVSLPARNFETKEKGNLPGILCTGGFITPWIAEASVRFIRNIAPRLRRQFPEIPLTFLGRPPAKKLADIFATEGDDLRLCYLTYVDDYIGFLSSDWIYVYPQRCGTGLQTKVQQAMALGLPAVGYPIAFSALDVTHGEHCFVCNKEEEFAEYITLLLEDPSLRAKMGGAAARHVRENFTIEGIGKKMFELY